MLDVLGALGAVHVIIWLSIKIEQKTKILKRVFSFYGENSLIIMCFHSVEHAALPWSKVLKFCSSHGMGSGKPIVIVAKITIVTLSVLLVKKIEFLSKIFCRPTNLQVKNRQTGTL